MGNYTTRRMGRLRRSTGLPKQYKPEIWISGPSMYVTCPALIEGTYDFRKKSYIKTAFTKKQEQDFLKLIYVILRDTWDVDACNLTIDYEPDEHRYRINFNDEEEFVMVKLLRGWA